MNLQSEQLRSDLSLEIDFDQPLNPSGLIKKVFEALGENHCEIIKVNGKKIVKYRNKKGGYEILLLSAVTYMGGNGQHPIFKKRSQLKEWYKDIVYYYENKPEYHVRFIGVYHYKNNVIFLDYEKETFMKKKMHNSAVHVYTNDLYQAMRIGEFKRIDKNGNIIHAIKFTKFSDYLNDKVIAPENHLFEIFKEFNRASFQFGTWLHAKDVIPIMYNGWKKGEWPGVFLEYKFDKFCKENHLEQYARFVGNSNKKKGQFDFDIWFDLDNFYGDLKSSDITKHEAPANDQKNFIECINLYDKFWYILYEHETIKDSEKNNYEATKFRNHFMLEHDGWPKGKKFDELSYSKKMKCSVRYMKMTIIELNRINFRLALDEFHQGHQPDGSPRKPKFKINKRNIENFIIFQQKYTEIY